MSLLMKAAAAVTAAVIHVSPFMGIFDPGIPRHTRYAHQVEQSLGVTVVQEYAQLLGAPPAATIKANVRAGEITLLDVDPYGILTLPGMDHPPTPLNVNLAARVIISGKMDPYLRWYTYRLAAASRGGKVWVSWGHEMNGNWYPWGWDGTKPRLFRLEWRHVWRVMHRADRNVRWVWTINKLYPWSGGERQMARVTREDWPGRKYVSYVGIDSYFRRSGQRFFDRVVPTLRFVRRITRKPVILTETGVSPNPYEFAQLRSLVHGVIRWHLLGFMYFNLDELEHWQLTPTEFRYLSRLLRAARFAD